jgi:hypothetical protein
MNELPKPVQAQLNGLEWLQTKVQLYVRGIPNRNKKPTHSGDVSVRIRRWAAGAGWRGNNLEMKSASLNFRQLAYLTS